MKNGKDINLLIREALLRRKEGRPEVMLPEGFEDKVMEQIKASWSMSSASSRLWAMPSMKASNVPPCRRIRCRNSSVSPFNMRSTSVLSSVSIL